ncbi:hypothetical protein DXB08_28890 [Hungatella hathewayi]|nr:hypothetical protein DXB08_28890 [Hungatella hathewayi]
MICICGNNKFHAHQIVQCSIIVDEDNRFIKNITNGKNPSIYEPGVPFGPYTCTSCGRQYMTLMDDEMKHEMLKIK